jgi:hypothetical protein
MAPGACPAGPHRPASPAHRPSKTRPLLGGCHHSRWARPRLAAKPSSAGPSFWPRCKAVWPWRMSSPLRRIHCPASGCGQKRTRGVSPSGTRFGLLLHHDGVGPRGTGAPVKMRAAWPGCKASPGDPAAMRWPTRNEHPWATNRRAHGVAVHRRVVKGGHLQADTRSSAKTRPSASNVAIDSDFGQGVDARQQRLQRIVQGHQRGAWGSAHGLSVAVLHDVGLDQIHIGFHDLHPFRQLLRCLQTAVDAQADGPRLPQWWLQT